MSEGILGVHGGPINPDVEKQAKVEKDILTLEGLFFAINSTTYSPKFMDALNRGLQLLGNQHAMLLAQMSPDQVETMRKKYNQPAQPTIA